MKRKIIPIMIALALALMMALPAAVYADTPAAGNTPSTGSASATVQVEYRYAEGETPNILQDITQYGRTYHLVSQSAPTLESTLPMTRTYTYRIDGALTPEQLADAEALGNVTLTPVDLVYERTVDVEVVFPNPEHPQAVLTNDVDDIPLTWPCTVTSGTASGGHETKNLERAGVTYQLADPPHDKYGLPAGYIATVVYRGTETYSSVGYYIADVIYTTSEIDSETPVYVIVANYQADELPPQDIAFNPVPGSAAPVTDGSQDKLSQQGPNPILNIINGNVPLGGFNIQGVWSFLSIILALAGLLIAVIYLTGALLKRKRVRMLKNMGMFDEEYLARIKRRGNILRALTIILGLLTFVAELYLDDFSLGMVWINAGTVFVAILFIVTVVFCVFTNIRDKKTLGDDAKGEI